MTRTAAAAAVAEPELDALARPTNRLEIRSRTALQISVAGSWQTSRFFRRTFFISIRLRFRTQESI